MPRPPHVLAFPIIIILLLGCPTKEPELNQSTIRQHSDEFFKKLRQEEERKRPEQPAQVRSDQTAPLPPLAQPHVLHSRYSEDEYLIAIGHQDKGDRFIFGTYLSVPFHSP